MNVLTPERWKQLDTIFARALEYAPDERTAFLRHACGHDPVLYEEVLALLCRAEEAEQALGESATLFAAPLLSSLDLDEETEALRPVGPYRLLQRIGQGGMGDVYLAERTEGGFDQRVAVKLIRRGMDTDEMLRRFRYERRILAALHHPHIARLYDGGATDDGLPYLVMEYVAGQPLTRYCDAHACGVDARLALFQTVCAAVRYAHEHLVVHRDLKPSNILVTDDGEVKLLDFGIARLLDDDSADVLTRTGRGVLTPAYAAPEQVRGEPISTASDVYALGVLLYELLTGTRPAPASAAPVEQEPERPSLAAARATVTVAAARDTRPDRLCRRLRGDLDVIALTALRHDPARRYSSAGSLLADIERHLAGRPISARPDTWRYRARTFIRRNRTAVAVAAAALFLLISSGAFYGVLITAERDRARLEAAKATQVAAFLESLFAASDPFAPTSARLDTLRVGEFARLGAGRVQRDLADQPLVQAQMLSVVGRVHAKLGLREEARPLLAEALRLRRLLAPETQEEIAQSLSDYALLLYDDGAYDEADSLFNEVLVLRRALHGDNHEEVAAALGNLALTRHARGALDEAEAMHREALGIREKIFPAIHPEIATGLSTLATTLIGKGAYAEADSLLRASLAVRRAHYGEGHPAVAVGLNNLAVLLRDTGAYDEAEPLIREALAINRKALGNDHPNIADNLNLLGSILRNQGDYNAAEPVFSESLALRRKLHGNVHPAVSISLDTYAALLKAQQRYDEAEAAQREAVAIARQVFGDEHFAVAITTGKLAGIVHAKEGAAQALPLYRESAALMAAVLQADNPSLLMSRVSLAVCLRDLARYGDAERLLLESYETLRQTQGLESRFTQQALRSLAGLYETWGKPAQAAAYKALLAET